MMQNQRGKTDLMGKFYKILITKIIDYFPKIRRIKKILISRERNNMIIISNK